MICPNCKNEIDNDSRFCRHCGVELLDEEEIIEEIIEESDDLQNNFVPVEPEPVTKNTKNKKTLKLQLIVTAVVIGIVGIILAIVILSSGTSGSGNEKVTDAAGEVVRPGFGTTEISVMDEDGNVKTIKTDRTLVKFENILSEYTKVMNKLKSDSPAFSFIRYQNLPATTGSETATGNNSLGNIVGNIIGNTADFVLPIIENYVTSKSAATKTDYPAGNSDKLPLPNNSYGCLLTDSSKIKNAYCEIVSDDIYTLVITLNDESNPPVLSSGATSSQSAINSVFDTYDALYQITSVAELAMSECNFKYTDCTVRLTYNKDTEHVESITMKMNIDIEANVLNLVPVEARIVDICEFTDFVY